ERGTKYDQVAFAPDGMLAAAVSRMNPENALTTSEVRLLEPPSWEVADRLPIAWPALALAFSPDGETLAAGLGDRASWWTNMSARRMFPSLPALPSDEALDPSAEAALKAELASKVQALGTPAPKGEFETAAEYEARLRQAKDAEARLQDEHEPKLAEARRLAAEKRAAALESLRERREARERRVEKARSQVQTVRLAGTLGAYDADAETFSVGLDLNQTVLVRVPRDKARTLDRKKPVLVSWQVRYLAQAQDGQPGVSLLAAELLDLDTGEPLSPEAGVAGGAARPPAAAAAPPKLRIAELSFEDEGGDGVLDGGENGSLKVQAVNEGKGTASGVSLRLEPSAGSPVQGLRLPEKKYLGSLAPGESQTLEVPVSGLESLTAAETGLKISLSEADGFDSAPVVLAFKTRALQTARLEVAKVDVLDGDGGKAVTKGKEFELTLTVRNAGGGTARKARLSISSADPNIRIYGERQAFLGTLAGGASKKAVFTLAVAQRYSGSETLPLTFQLEEAASGPSAPEVKLTLGQEPEQTRVVRVEETAPVTAPGEDVAAPPSLAEGERTLGPNDFAVVIGIERYRNVPRSDYSGTDARLVKSYLKALGIPERNIELLIDDGATLSAINKTLDRWLVHRVKPGSRVVVYYSGHGAPDAESGQSFLVPYDGEPNYLQDTGYPLDKLKERLGRLPAAEVLVVLDSCFSGAGGRSVLAKGARPLVQMRKGPAPAGNTAVLSASEASQTSSSSPEKGHGILTYYLLKAIKDGRKDISAAYAYLRPLVEDEAKTARNATQTPVLEPAPEKLTGRFRLRR
ncbi:MAG: caspase family protein, partial [Elusimicrobiota bacterium]